MTKQMSIAGVVHHINAIISQGRTEEYLNACEAQGFTEITAPDGLIAFTREFLALEQVPQLKGLSDTMTSSVTQMLKNSLQTERRFIDECDC
jgi:bacterioferritin (cytochrome b1)